MSKLFSGHEAEVICLEVSLDNSVLFSGSLDKTLRVWLIKNHQCLRSLSFEGPVTNLNVSLYQTVNTFDFARVKIPQLSRTVADSADFGAVLPLRFSDDFTNDDDDDDDDDGANSHDAVKVEETKKGVANFESLMHSREAEALKCAIDSEICELFKKISEKM